MSSLPKAIEGLTDVGKNLGDLKFVMSKVRPGASQEQVVRSPQELLKRAFVLQASIGFDAKEIKYVLSNRKDRLESHEKTLRERDMPWFVDIEKAWPEVLQFIKAHDPSLCSEFVSLDIANQLARERALITGLTHELQEAMHGAGHEGHAQQLCDELIGLSQVLFPLFSRAKDAVGMLKAQGAI